MAHESVKDDRIPQIVERGQMSFSVFTYATIHVQCENGDRHLEVDNPEHVQIPLLREIMGHLQGHIVCTCDSVSATPTNWVIDRILGKI